MKLKNLLKPGFREENQTYETENLEFQRKKGHLNPKIHFFPVSFATRFVKIHYAPHPYTGKVLCSDQFYLICAVEERLWCVEKINQTSTDCFFTIFVRSF